MEVGCRKSEVGICEVGYRKSEFREKIYPYASLAEIDVDTRTILASNGTVPASNFA